MKKIVLALLLIGSFISLTFADYAPGYTKKTGKYVKAYNRSHSNKTVRDNYSYKGNVNPYTGRKGKSNYKHSSSSTYYSGTKSNKKKK